MLVYLLFSFAYCYQLSGEYRCSIVNWYGLEQKFSEVPVPVGLGEEMGSDGFSTQL